MKYKLNGLLWFGLGLFIEAMAGLLKTLDLGANYYFVFIGMTFAALIIEVIGISSVGNYGTQIIWGRGFIMIAAIIKSLSMALGFNGVREASGIMLGVSAGCVLAAIIIQLLGVYNILRGCEQVATLHNDNGLEKQFRFARHIYIGLVVISIVLCNFFSQFENTFSMGLGMAGKILLIVGAALVSMRLIQLASKYNNKTIEKQEI